MDRAISQLESLLESSITDERRDDVQMLLDSARDLQDRVMSVREDHWGPGKDPLTGARLLSEIGDMEDLGDLHFTAARWLLDIPPEYFPESGEHFVRALFARYLRSVPLSAKRHEIEYFATSGEFRREPSVVTPDRERLDTHVMEGLYVSHRCGGGFLRARDKETVTVPIELPPGRYWKSHDVRIWTRNGNTDYDVRVDPSGRVVYATVIAMNHKKCTQIVVDFGPRSWIGIDVSVITSSLPAAPEELGEVVPANPPRVSRHLPS